MKQTEILRNRKKAESTGFPQFAVCHFIFTQKQKSRPKRQLGTAFSFVLSILRRLSLRNRVLRLSNQHPISASTPSFWEVGFFPRSRIV